MDNKVNYFLVLLVYFHVKLGAASASCWISRIAPNLTMECDSALPSDDQKRTIYDLHLRLCAQSTLPNDTFVGYPILYFLRIQCRNEPSDGNSLALEGGIFVPVRQTLEKMTISHNHMPLLADGLFCGVTALKTLNLEHNGLGQIARAGFGDSCDVESNLEYLYLNNNRIRLLTGNTFSRLGRLHFLGISTNGLREIQDGAFAGLVALRQLHLRKNNLAYLPPNVFAGLRNLSELILSENQLTTGHLPSFEHVRRLDILHLGNNQLTALTETTFANLSRLSELDLSGNRLGDVGAAFRPLTNLRSLKMNGAGVTRIRSAAFSAAGHLQELFLKFNRLETFDCGLLLKTNITVLDLSGNNFTAAARFGDLPGLKSLFLSSNNITDLTFLTSTMPKGLRHIGLAGNRVKCIERLAFVNLTSLEDLDLQKNKISSIADGAFEQNRKLKTVNLNHNELPDLPMALFAKTSAETISASHNRIRRLSYAGIPSQTWKLNLAHNAITDAGMDVVAAYSVDPDTGQFDDGLFVTDIDLSFNNLQTFNSKNFPFSSRVLALHDNLISTVDPSWDFLKLNNLERVTLHNNKLASFCDLHDDRFGPRTKINVTLRGNPLNCTCQLKWLSDQTGQARSFTVSDRTEIQCTTNRPKVRQRKRVYDLQPNDFLCASAGDRPSTCECRSSTDQCWVPCPESCVCYHDSPVSLVIIDCSLRNLTQVPVAPSSLDDASLHLYLDGNSIGSINESSLIGYQRLNSLYLNRSSLRSMSHGTFHGFARLHTLHLEGNRIDTVPEGLFRGLDELQELHLSQNQILALAAATFLPLVKLATLKLDRNLLSKFPAWDLSQLPRLANVTLGGNPWSCDCEFATAFRSWLQRNAKIVSDVERVHCSPGPADAAPIPLIAFNSSECYPHDLTTLVATAPVWSSLLGIFVFLTVAAVLAFAYRKEMQVLIYSRYGVRLFYRRDAELDKDKEYDAFVAYSNSDVEFLVNELLPGLEAIPNPYRLCLHHKDFIVGAFITENIMEAVERSCRTIILLSESFVNSEWCQFEFKMAHLQMLSDQCNRVIVIVLDKVPLGVDEDIKLYLKTNTYLEWGDRLFWEKLYFVLPDRATTPNGD